MTDTQLMLLYLLCLCLDSGNLFQEPLHGVFDGPFAAERGRFCEVGHLFEKLLPHEQPTRWGRITWLFLHLQTSGRNEKRTGNQNIYHLEMSSVNKISAFVPHVEKKQPLWQFKPSTFWLSTFNQYFKYISDELKYIFLLKYRNWN